MRWADVELDTGVWSKPYKTTKQRQPHRVPLNEEAVALLRRRNADRDGPIVRLHRDEHVFRGGGDVAHIGRLERDWREIRAAAGLEDVRIHDLRHSFASVLVGQGLSLPIIGAMLGHSRPATTHRYAHLADAPLRERSPALGGLGVGQRQVGRQGGQFVLQVGDLAFDLAGLTAGGGDVAGGRERGGA